MLNLCDLSVNQNGLQVVHKVALDVFPKETVAMVGPNGAGKTSVARVIVGLLAKSEGTIQVVKDGQRFDLSLMQPWEIVRLGIIYVPESGHIFENMSVGDNLAVAGAAFRKDRIVIQRQVEAVCNIFPFLTARLKQRAGTLSGGEKRALAIARSLIILDLDDDAAPETVFKLLILDEPSHGLDPVALDRLRSLIMRLKAQGFSLLLIDQFASFVLGLADRGYSMHEGRIVRSGPAEELIAIGSR